jgi:hypothetical protein
VHRDDGVGSGSGWFTNRAFAENACALGNWTAWKVLPDQMHCSAIRKLGEPADPTFTTVRDSIRRFSDGARR